MSGAAPIKSYEPEHLEKVWTLTRRASRTSLGTGVSAAIWTSGRPVEIWGSADLSFDVLSMALRPYRCEAWADNKKLQFEHCRTSSLQIMPAAASPRAYFHEPIELLHLNFPHHRLADIAAVAPGALELSDPLAQFDSDIADTCHRLARELNVDCTMSQLHFDALTTSIGVQIVRRWSNRGTKVTPFRGGLPPARLRRVEEFLMAHLADDVGLDTLAAIADLSPKHFARAFRQSTGMPPHRWLIEQRIDRAKALLRKGDASLAEIALACGFADQSHFTVTFRKMVGATPGCFQKEFGNEPHLG
jgi:AraC family transcriptional regulator